MSLSGALSLDPADHAAASSTLAARLADLEQRRRDAQRSVEALLATWLGDAAGHFGTRWHDWDGAASEVIEALASLLGAIDSARCDLVLTDDAPAARADVLGERLG